MRSSTVLPVARAVTSPYGCLPWPSNWPWTSPTTDADFRRASAWILATAWDSRSPSRWPRSMAAALRSRRAKAAARWRASNCREAADGTPTGLPVETAYGMLRPTGGRTMATAAAAAVAQAQRRIQHEFFQADAVRPDRAITFDPQ